MPSMFQFISLSAMMRTIYISDFEVIQIIGINGIFSEIRCGNTLYSHLKRTYNNYYVFELLLLKDNVLYSN